MKFSQETLMAYADGELDAETRRAIEEAMKTDAGIAREIERHRALRSDLQRAFSGSLTEAVPERLIRAARVAKASTKQRAGWRWPQLTALAASLLIGVIAGRTWLQTPDLLAMTGGRIVAGGRLADALSNDPSGSDVGEVWIGSTFLAKSGEYCRTFIMEQESPVAGFACRDEESWRVQALADAVAQAGGNYRMASTQLPASVLQAIDGVIEGEALDAEQEAAAISAGWQSGARQ